MKRIAFISALIFLVVGLLFWASQSFVTLWEPALRTEVEQRLGRVLHARVQIAHLELTFPRSIHLVHVEVWNLDGHPAAPLLRAQDISLTFSLLDLPHALIYRRAEDTIGLITFDVPIVSLSPDILKNRLPVNGRGSHPLFFAVSWNRGALEWTDSRLPKGKLSLRDSSGIFRLRGPQMDVTGRGTIDPAQSIDLRYSAFAKRWHGSARVRGGDLSETLIMLQHLTGKAILPQGAQLEGQYAFDMKCAGSLPMRGHDLLGTIQEGQFEPQHTRLVMKPGTPPIEIAGNMAYKKTRITLSKINLHSGNNSIQLSGSLWPFGSPRFDLQATGQAIDLGMLSVYFPKSSVLLRGKADMQVNLTGPVANPDLTMTARIPKGQFQNWPFEDADLHARYSKDHWEIANAALRVWQGDVTLKGYASRALLDIQLTANEVSLPDALPPGSGMKGKINLAVAIRGSLDDPHTQGSFWINNLSWGNPQSESVQGNIELTSKAFQLQAASQDSEVRLASEGTRSLQSFDLDRLTLHLRSNATINAQGSLDLASKGLQFSVRAENLKVPEDVPALPARLSALHGQINLNGSVEGTLIDPLFEGQLSSQNLKLGDQTLPSTTATMKGSHREVALTAFHLEPGVTGSWRMDLRNDRAWNLNLTAEDAPWTPWAAFFSKPLMVGGLVSGKMTLTRGPTLQGKGEIKLQNTQFAGLSITHANLRFGIHDRKIDVDNLLASTENASLEMAGHGDWTPVSESALPDSLNFDAKGKLFSTGSAASWDLPLRVQGHVRPREKWSGDLTLLARSVHIRDQDTDPLRVAMHWDAASLKWDHTQWGAGWTSQGLLRFNSEGSPALSGQLTARQASLSRGQKWLWPQVKEPVDGFVSGTLDLGGTLRDPLLQFSGFLQKASWRAFHFDSDIHAIWKNNLVEPLALNGKLASGGTFHFRGRVVPFERTAAGTLELSDFNLTSIGKTLSFPHPLRGSANGTFTVSGPINGLRLAGHLDGTSVAYGEPPNSPIRLENISADLTLEPRDQTGVTRLTLSQASAKTQEEEIRLTSGSYVEFAGHHQARLRIGSEIRNLHLGLFTLFGGLDILGTWEIKPEGFALNGDAHTRSLFINDYELEEGHVQAGYYNGLLTFTAPPNNPALLVGTLDLRHAPQLKFSDFYISGKEHQGLRIAGDIGPSLWDFTLRGQGLDISTLGGLAGFAYPIEGSASVNITGTGDLQHPQVQGDLQVQDGSALGLHFETGTAAFIWQGNRMTFTRLTLTDPGRYTLSGAGVFPMATKASKVVPGSRAIDFSVRLENSNLGLLQSISKEVKQAKGPVQGLLQIKGTADAPSFRGSIRVQHGDVLGAHYFRHLENFSLSGEFDGNVLTINDFSGKSGPGLFRGGGRIVYAGFEPESYDLHFDVPSSKGIDVVVPELAIPESPLAKKIHFLTTASHGNVKGHVTFQGSAESPSFAGSAFISNGHFTFPPQAKHQPSTAFLDWMRRINWDVDLQFGDGAWFENELVEANLVGDLRLKGPSDRLRVDGGMDISEGEISYLGIQFGVQEARFDVKTKEIAGTLTVTPFVRGIADSQVQTVDQLTGQGVDDTITLTIDYAPVNEIKPRLVSALNPSLPQDKLFARVTQLELENLSPQERSYLYQQQMVRLIDTSLATPLARNLLKRTGLVDELRVSRVINPAAAGNSLDPNAVNTTQQQTAVNLLAGTKYTLAKNLSNKLSLGYGLRFEQITTPDTLESKLDLRSDVELSYRMLSNVYLRGSFDLPSSNPGALPDRRVTIEPRWRFGWWGNTNKPKPNSTSSSNN